MIGFGKLLLIIRNVKLNGYFRFYFTILFMLSIVILAISLKIILHHSYYSIIMMVNLKEAGPCLMRDNAM